MSHLRSAGLFVLLAACGGEPPEIYTANVSEPPAAAIEEPPTTRDRLASGLVLGLDRDASAISIAVTRDNVVYDARPLALDGAVAVRVRGESLGITSLTVEIDDVMLPHEEFPPHGIHLTAIAGAIHLSPLKPSWIDENHAIFEARANVRVEWKLVREDGELEIRPLEVEDIELSGDLRISEESVSLKMRALAPGVLFEVANVIEMSDLSLTLALTDR
jgi:hypothetical protein